MRLPPDLPFPSPYPPMPADEVEQAREKVHELQEQATKLFGKGGRSRQIVEGDRG